LNVFAWSLPFVAEKVAELLVGVFNLVDDKEADKEEDLIRRRDIIRHKVITVSKLLILYKRMRDEREALLAAGSLSPKGTELPITLALSYNTSDTVRQALSNSLEDDTFQGARVLDRPNEARPPLSQTLPISQTTPQQLKRYASRDKILLWKRNSLPTKTHADIVKDSTLNTPEITESQ